MPFDNLILIKGGAYNKIKKALKDWLELYSDTVQEGLIFQIFKKEKGFHIIQVDKILDNEIFFSLINYLKYPVGIEYKITIEGFTIGKAIKCLRDKNLLVYISPYNIEYDNVLLVTSDNINFKVDFDGNVTKVADTKIYWIPEGFQFEIKETITFAKSNLKNTESKKSTIKTAKRFRIISLIIVALISSTYLTLIISQELKLFYDYTSVIGVGIWFWFWADDIMLRENKLYKYCIYISISFAIYGVLLHSLYGHLIFSLILWSSLLPLTILIMQKPLRHLYLKNFKKEPIINSMGKLSDFFYTLILFFGSLFIPMLLIDLLNS
ncbi:MAG: hypothetical protein LAT75_08295 [Candidatus Cyclonatronum sp.]|uniref:hypothetical protein n=1 Tax=Cyclonatronum sp. TaxID=3024185 RepID=UPI0025BACFA2|nr:hypothetical protein [Cyclonatronum sp.]MCH8486851.1 hypothetical protein [Cyclonatronum sp.]